MVSPPPATLTSLPAVGEFGRGLGDGLVPVSNGSISKAPNGPFHTRVFEPRQHRVDLLDRCAGRCRGSCRRRRPASTATTRTAHWPRIPAPRRHRPAGRSRDLALVALSRMARAVCRSSLSHSDLPIVLPCAERNVLAMAPPMISISTLASDCRADRAWSRPWRRRRWRRADARVSSACSSASSSACMLRPA